MGAIMARQLLERHASNTTMKSALRVTTDFIYQLIYVQRICARVFTEVALPVKIVRQMGPAFVKVAKAQ